MDSFDVPTPVQCDEDKGLGNIANYLPQIARQHGEALAISVQQASGSANQYNYNYSEMSFAELERQSNIIARALIQYGIEADMRVVLMVTPSLDFFALTFALFKVGAIPIMVDPGMGVKNLKKCFEESEPQAFIGIPKSHIARILFGWAKKSLKKRVTVGCFSPWGGTTLSRLLEQVDGDDGFTAVSKNPDELAAILFTSGSTGVPKGVFYSHRMFNAQLSVLRDDYGIQFGERDLATFPLFSLFGPALGMASIIPDMDASKPITANPKHVIAAVEKYQCSNLFANPALMEIIGNYGLQNKMKLSSLQRVISAGAPAIPEIIKNFVELLDEGVEVQNSYGATESLPISKIGSTELLEDTAEATALGAGICVGKPVSAVNLGIITITEEVIEQWSDDLLLPDGEIGEIVVKGPNVSPEYYRRPKATQAAKIPDGDGFYHRMGDVGYLDDQGKVWMCGRKAHRVEINTGTLFSISCERIFNEHPEVKRTALVGIDQQAFQLPVLCIERDAKQKTLTDTQLIDAMAKIAGQHPRTQSIRHFLIHPAFPVDVRHNAKIFREKLAVWAEKKLQGRL